MATRVLFFFFQAEDGIRDDLVTGVQTCALPISNRDSPSLFRDRDWSPLPAAHRPSWFDCSPAFQTHAPAEPARASAESRAKYLQLRRGTACPDRPVPVGRSSEQSRR